MAKYAPGPHFQESKAKLSKNWVFAVKFDDVFRYRPKKQQRTVKKRQSPEKHREENEEVTTRQLPETERSWWRREFQTLWHFLTTQCWGQKNRCAANLLQRKNLNDVQTFAQPQPVEFLPFEFTSLVGWKLLSTKASGSCFDAFPGDLIWTFCSNWSPQVGSQSQGRNTEIWSFQNRLLVAGLATGNTFDAAADTSRGSWWHFDYSALWAIFHRIVSPLFTIVPSTPSLQSHTEFVSQFFGLVHCSSTRRWHSVYILQAASLQLFIVKDPHKCNKCNSDAIQEL